MSTYAKADAKDTLGSELVARNGFEETFKAPKFRYQFECFDKDGNLKWTEDVTNLVTTAGGNDLIDKYFKGSAYTAAWVLGLAGAGTKAAADTMASHAAWSEITAYTGSTNRPSITFGTTSAKSNTATTVSYSINGTATVAGAFVSNTAATSPGNTGIMYSVSDFSSSRSVVNGDTLNVTLTVTV
jgi:hypothetical protein